MVLEEPARGAAPGGRTAPIQLQSERKRLPRLSNREHFAGVLDAASYSLDARGHDAYADGTVEGRPVTVAADVHLVTRALDRRTPLVALITGAGADLKGGPRGIGMLDPTLATFGPLFPRMLYRRRDIPVVALVVHHSFGDSTFFTGLCDFVVQVEGKCLALAGPRVLAVGTGEEVTMEQLGGVAVHAGNGQVDVVAATYQEAYAAARRFLYYLPSNREGLAPVTPPGQVQPPHRPDDRTARDFVRGDYDATVLVSSLADGGQYFETKAGHARSISTGFARLGGHPVGIVASVPRQDGGAWSQDACLKASQHIALCDSFGLPLVFLQHSSGWPDVSTGDPSGCISRSLMLLHAVERATVPRCSVVIGRAMGPGFLLLGALRSGLDLSVGWPNYRLGLVAEPPEPGAADERHAVTCADGVVEPEGTRERLISHLRAIPAAAMRHRRSSLCQWPVGF